MREKRETQNGYFHCNENLNKEPKQHKFNA